MTPSASVYSVQILLYLLSYMGIVRSSHWPKKVLQVQVVCIVGTLQTSDRYSQCLRINTTVLMLMLWARVLLPGYESACLQH